MQTDEALLEQIRCGELSAFDDLILAHQDRVYGLCLRMCGNREDAFDLSQEVFLRVFRALGAFKSESTFTTWLYRLTMNVCLDHLRKTLKRREIIQMELNAEGDPPDVPDERFAPESAWAQTELRENISKALTRLTPEHRSIVILRDIQQFSYAEIAEILACEEGTVKSRLFRAREALRRTLSHDGNLLQQAPSNQAKGGTAS